MSDQTRKSKSAEPQQPPASEFREHYPEAKVLRPQDRSGWWELGLLWLPPLALAGAIASFVLVSQDEGREISVRFKQGHGLKVGDAVKHRGIEVGSVTGIGLSEDLGGVVARLRLRDEANGLAREGTQFWIERPQLSLGKLAVSIR